jgi:Tfp pilus assembly protein PilO
MSLRNLTRKQLWDELEEVFDLADEMTGSHDPDVIDDERIRIRQLKAELRRRLIDGEKQLDLRQQLFRLEQDLKKLRQQLPR